MNTFDKFYIIAILSPLLLIPAGIIRGAILCRMARRRLREICVVDLFDYIPIGSHIINNCGWIREVTNRTIIRVFSKKSKTFSDQKVLITRLLSGPYCGEMSVLTRELFHDMNWHLK